MKLDKGLFTDCQEIDQPQGSYRFAKNIVQTNISEELENEPGFTSLGTVAPYAIIGFIAIGESFIIFSTDDTNCEIGKYDGTTYTAIYNNVGLGFKKTNPIKGEYQIDYKNHTIIAWIDKLNPPRTLDIDDIASVSNVEDLVIFNKATSPLISFTISNTGGTVVTGAYFPVTRYVDNSGSITPWYVHPRAVYINDDSTSESFDQQDGALGGSGSSKAISLTLTEVDTKYDNIEVGFISVIAGVTTAFSVRKVAASSTTTFSYTGSETITELTLDEVITSPASYSNARAITQLNNRLFLANLSSDDNIDFQYYANRIQLNYTFELVDRSDVSKSTTAPGFRAGEVYAFYILLELKSGKTLAYHIPGRPYEGTEFTFTADATSGLSYWRFQVDNTTDSASIYSNMGFWANLTEAYPDNFPTGIDGGVLAGSQVRHHRFPTLDYLVASQYGGDPTVGITKLPRLGINAFNVNIPSNIRSKISRWRIAYAKKEYNNSLVVGQDILQFGADKVGIDANIRMSTGGNWNVNHSGVAQQFELQYDKLRSHCLDLFYDKPKIVPSYIHFLYYLETNTLNTQYSGFGTTGGKLASSGNTRGDSPGCVTNFTNAATTRTDIATYKRAIDNFEFVNPNSLAQSYISTYKSEGIITAEIFGAVAATPPVSWIGTTSEFLYYTGAPPNTNIFNTGGGKSDAEPTLLYNFCQIIDNVHTDFSSQPLILTDGSTTDMTATSISDIYNGDCYICFQSYTSLGLLRNDETDPLKGIRTFKWWLGEAKNNWGYRHEGSGINGLYTPKTDPRNLWFPVTDGTNLVGTILDGFQTQINQINYNSDYSAKSEYTPALIIRDPNNFVTEFPTTIIFSLEQGTEAKSSWRSFLANDRYVQPRNKGAIYNLQGIDNIDLLIHHKYNLYKTRTNTGLQGDLADVQLRSASLFAISPTEILTSDSGYGGTQNPLSCILTKAGYFFVDDIQGKVFLYTDKLSEISSNGLRAFFRDNLDVAEDNSFTSNGYTAWFDESYNRLLLSKKQNSTSATASFSPQDGIWVSYHDYTPDGIVVLNNTKQYSIKSNEIFLHNSGPPGKYYEVTPFPTKIDVVFNPEAYKKKVFSSFEWTTEVFSSSGVLQPDTTFDYLTIRNAEQCSDKVPIERLDNTYAFYDQNARVLNRSWFFNNFRDVAISPNFLEDFYSDYELDTTKLNSSMEWYEQRKFIDKFVTCRFEYSNTDGHRLIFLDSLVNYRLSAR